MLEQVLYKYKDKGISFQAAAQLERGTESLARRIVVTVFLGGQAIFVRRISGYRGDKPSITEMVSVHKRLLRAIADAAKLNPDRSSKS